VEPISIGGETVAEKASDLATCIQKNKTQASDIWANTNRYDQVIVDGHEDGRVVGTGVDDGHCDPSDSPDKVP
jgi:hypothetical protein